MILELVSILTTSAIADGQEILISDGENIRLTGTNYQYGKFSIGRFDQQIRA